MLLSLHSKLSSQSDEVTFVGVIKVMLGDAILTFFTASSVSSAHLRWSDLMKRLLQTGQMKFFSPVCVRICRASSSERANFLIHPFQVQGKGRSPEMKQISQVLQLFIMTWYAMRLLIIVKLIL